MSANLQQAFRRYSLDLRETQAKMKAMAREWARNPLTISLAEFLAQETQAERAQRKADAAFREYALNRVRDPVLVSGADVLAYRDPFDLSKVGGFEVRPCTRP